MKFARKDMKEGSPQTFILLGKFARPFGVHGFVHIHSYTEDPQALLEYQPWYLKTGHSKAEWQIIECAEVRMQGASFVVRPEGCEDRDVAATFTNVEIYVKREVLPELPEGEFYWADLIGLTVVTTNDQYLGTVTQLLETGANDVLIVQGEEREHLIPYVPEEYIVKIDLVAGVIRVNWDPEF